MGKKISKTIQSKTDNLLEVREFILDAARKIGFPDEEASKIVLAVDEACTNIIKHAYQFASDKSIHIDVTEGVNSIQICISDEGKAFNPSTIKTPDLKQHLASFRRGGLGVYLMKTLMDKVEYSIAPGKRNIVRLTKYLTPESSATQT
ncbi:MAG: ATP-binding protein [bacterium]